ncbi:MAG: oligoendopeptidase F, partial [Spirochaetota bacterium]
QLDNADFSFGTVTNSKGETRELSHGNFNTFLMDRDRTVRQTAFFQYYEVYDSHRYSLAAALASSMKKDWLHARIRNHASCRSASLFSDNVDVSVYDNLVAATRANIGGMSAYMELRRLVLDLDSLHFYDTYVPMVDTVDISIPYEEAVEICLEALSPLGSEYTGILREGLLGGWVDRYENRGKRSGAYSSGCYDSYPYILLNYDSSNINSLYTLIHEAGHSMHSYYSVQNQPYHYHDYTIFVAEVASTFNETLLSDHLMKRYSHDPLMKKYIINRELENLRGTLFRQTMFAEFEHVIHSLVETDTPVTVETLRHEYRKLLDFYFNGSIVIDDVLELECLRIPHFYSAFYVYKYATGIAAAISLAERVIAGETPALDNYLKFLSLGGSMFPLDELKTAGVDMTTPGPVEKALARFSTLIEDFTSLM